MHVFFKEWAVLSLDIITEACNHPSKERERSRERRECGGCISDLTQVAHEDHGNVHIYKPLTQKKVAWELCVAYNKLHKYVVQSDQKYTDN